MDLRDFALSPTSPPQPKERAILEKLQTHLALGKKLLQEKRFLQGQFRMWMGSVKRDLKAI